MVSQISCKYLFPFLFSFTILIYCFTINFSDEGVTKTSALINEASSNEQLINISNQTTIDCARYKFKSNLAHTPLPIYDFFVLNDELDILEIRLYETYEYVKFFLIAESSTTFSGKDKPLYLKENWSKFSKYHDKIRRFEVKLDRNGKGAWSNEYHMRDEGLRLAQETITDNKYILLTSDADEIPKARFMNALSHCSLPESFCPSVLICDFYYYSYEFRNKPHVLLGSTVNLIDRNQTNFPSGQTLRDARNTYQHINSSCFHCTWCFNELKKVRLKMASYSHTEHNEERFRARDHIIDHFQHGKDLFDRKGEEYIYIANNTELPRLVQLQSERFKFMTQRARLPNAGFIDA